LASGLHPRTHFSFDALQPTFSNNEMASNALEAARERYRAAYAAYVERAQRVAQDLEKGLTPSVQEVLAEAQATERLATARRDVLDAMARMRPGRP
jgi:hypothetical protein